MAQRILWSLILLLALVPLLGRIGALRAALANRRLVGQLAITAALIATNWLTFMWAVSNGHVLATSLGYFLNPLINVALGRIFLGEALSRWQAAAVALAAIGVAILAFEAAETLWISLVLAVAFSVYGLVRKVAPVDSFEGLTIETALLAPLSLGYIGWLAAQGGLSFGADPVRTALLIASGGVTAVPLLLFAAAAQRLRYSTVGIIQYLAPTITFFLAIFVLHEPLRSGQLVCFAFIWIACLVYAASSLAEHRRHRLAGTE